jgi:hypothetical protein
VVLTLWIVADCIAEINCLSLRGEIRDLQFGEFVVNDAVKLVGYDLAAQATSGSRETMFSACKLSWSTGLIIVLEYRDENLLEIERLLCRPAVLAARIFSS